MDIDIISIFNPPKKDENEKIKDLNGFRKPSQITKRTVVNAAVLFSSEKVQNQRKFTIL